MSRSQGCTYSFHPETTTTVHHLKELLVFLAAEPAQLGNLEVRPEMAHVVRLALHGFRVDFRQASTTRICAHDLFGQWGLVVGIILRNLWRWLLSRLNKHFPETLGGNVVEALVSRSVAEDVGYSLSQFLDGNSEAICLVALDHLQEGVTVAIVSTRKSFACGLYEEDVLSNVAKVLDLGLQAPVPFVLGQKGMLVEESRVEAAHSVVTLESTVHDGGITLFGDAFLSNLVVDPIRVSPHLGANSTKLDSTRGVVADDIFECLIKLAIVQKDVGVVEPSVEVAFDGLYRLDDTVKLLIPGEDDESTIGPRFVDFGLRVEATGDEHLVMLFADFPVGKNIS